jgi:hypothetical protein
MAVSAECAKDYMTLWFTQAGAMEKSDYVTQIPSSTFLLHSTASTTYAPLFPFPCNPAAMTAFQICFIITKWNE